MVLCWYCMKRPARHLVELHRPPGLIRMSLSTKPGGCYAVDFLLFCSMKCAGSMGIRVAHERDGGSFWCPECADWKVREYAVKGDEEGCPHFPGILERIIPEAPPCLCCGVRPARPLRTREPAPQGERFFCGTRCAADFGFGSEGGSWYWSEERRAWLDRDIIPAPEGTPGRVIHIPRYSPEEIEAIEAMLGGSDDPDGGE